jgi:hypothetical protein
VFWLAVAATAVWTVDSAFGHERMTSPAAPGAVQHQQLADALTRLKPLQILLVTLAVLGSMAALVVRFRRAKGTDRQQFKVLTFTTCVVIAVFVAAGATAAIDPVNQLGIIGAIFWVSALAGVIIGLPVAIGIAILRHNLYGIDVVINRALVYGTLTLLLGATYVAGVVLAEQILADFASGSNLAVAGTTLLVAALVRPVRSRVQRAVDRRFFRHKYDAARTINSFSARLRDELDLDTLVGEVRVVISETMQPRHVSVWLRQEH